MDQKLSEHIEQKWASNGDFQANQEFINNNSGAFFEHEKKQ